jgi:hypothetical protein
MILDINAGSIMFALTPDRLRSRAIGPFNVVNWWIRRLEATVGALAGALRLLGSPVTGSRDLPEEAV